MSNAPILVVEDNVDDVVLIRRTLARSAVPNPRHFVKTGEAAISYLKGVGPYSDRKKFPLPDLVLLDLRLPVMDGFEVLQWIRANPDFRDLRVVVLTTSEEMRDVSKAYRLGANSFLVKPLEFENIRAFFRTIGSQLWNKDAVAAPAQHPPRTRNEEVDQKSGTRTESLEGHWTLE